MILDAYLHSRSGINNKCKRTSHVFLYIDGQFWVEGRYEKINLCVGLCLCVACVWHMCGICVLYFSCSIVAQRVVETTNRLYLQMINYSGRSPSNILSLHCLVTFIVKHSFSIILLLLFYTCPEQLIKRFFLSERAILVKNNKCK